MTRKAGNSFKMGYALELDTSPELYLVTVSYYLTIIGMLRWILELRRIDIITEVLLLSSHVASLERDIWKKWHMLWLMLVRSTTPD